MYDDEILADSDIYRRMFIDYKQRGMSINNDTFS